MWLQKPPLGVPLNLEDPINKGLVMHLAMNAGHGDVVRDLSMYGNHGKLHGFAYPQTVASGWNPGRDGVGLNFDGVDDYVDCGNSLSLNTGSEITFSAWCNIETFPVSYVRICNKGWAGAGSFTMMRDSSNNKIRFSVHDGVTASQAVSATITLRDVTLRLGGQAGKYNYLISNL